MAVYNEALGESVYVLLCVTHANEIVYSVLERINSCGNLMYLPVQTWYFSRETRCTSRCILDESSGQIFLHVHMVACLPEVTLSR